MRKQIFFRLPLPFFFLLLVMMTSCFKDEVETTETYTVLEPLYISVEEAKNSFSVQPARPLQKPGKIYIYGKYLFINEIKKGVHIIDNGNPASPSNIAFLNIPGNVDIAVKDNVLYADNYNDLLALDITSPTHVQLLNRVEKSFKTYRLTNDGKSLIDYVEKKVTVKNGNGHHNQQDDVIFLSNGGTLATADMSSAGGGGNKSAGKGGSMARFTIYENNLYIVDNNNLHHYNISAPSQPLKGQEIQIGWGIETIFPYKDKLFIGSTTGMIIYGLDNPASPNLITRYEHVNSCDPVVVSGDLAYVTLRSGTFCQGFSNQLEVIDIKNIQNPKLIKTYPMTNPHGLGIDMPFGSGINKDILFICDGSDGLKVYEAHDPEKISNNRIGHYKDFDAYDVIPHNNTLILIGKNGIRQYDYSDPKKLKLLSLIPVVNI